MPDINGRTHEMTKESLDRAYEYMPSAWIVKPMADIQVFQHLHVHNIFPSSSTNQHECLPWEQLFKYTNSLAPCDDLMR
jgi:hypothetical protein